MIHRVGKCFGIPLWKGSHKYVELWICLSAVKPHRHPGQNSEIVPIFGWSKFIRVRPVEGVICSKETPTVETVTISPRKWFRAFSVPAGWLHWFSGVPLIFLNISDKPQSAGVNLAYES